MKDAGYYDGNQTPVGPDTVNGYGLYDIIGNAPEWTRTSYETTVDNYESQESLLYTRNIPFRYGYSTSDLRIYRGFYNDYIYKRRNEAGTEMNGFRVARRYNATDLSTQVVNTMNFEWSTVRLNQSVDGWSTGYYSHSGDFAICTGSKGNGVKCTATDNSDCYLQFLFSTRRIGYFTLKAKNTSDVVRKLHLQVCSYQTESSSSNAYLDSNPIELPANMSDFQTFAFDGCPALKYLTIYMTSGVVIDEVEFHEIVE